MHLEPCQCAHVPFTIGNLLQDINPAFTVFQVLDPFFTNRWYHMWVSFHLILFFLQFVPNLHKRLIVMNYQHIYTKIFKYPLFLPLLPLLSHVRHFIIRHGFSPKSITVWRNRGGKVHLLPLTHVSQKKSARKKIFAYLLSSK